MFYDMLVDMNEISSQCHDWAFPPFIFQTSGVSFVIKLRNQSCQVCSGAFWVFFLQNLFPTPVFQLAIVQCRAVWAEGEWRKQLRIDWTCAFKGFNQRPEGDFSQQLQCFVWYSQFLNITRDFPQHIPLSNLQVAAILVLRSTSNIRQSISSGLCLATSKLSALSLCAVMLEKQSLTFVYLVFGTGLNCYCTMDLGKLAE